MTRISLLLCGAIIVFSLSIQSAAGEIVPLPRGVKAEHHSFVTGASPPVLGKEDFYEHIDGEAEFFIRFGAEVLSYAYYREGEREYPVDLFRFSGDEGAYGVYRVYAGCGEGEEREVGKGLVTSLEGVIYGVKGRYFFRIFPPEGGRGEALSLAEALVKRTPGSAPPPEVRALTSLPGGGACVEYFPDNLFPGVERSRGYRWEEGRVKCFLFKSGKPPGGKGREIEIAGERCRLYCTGDGGETVEEEVASQLEKAVGRGKKERKR
ncbi:MAG: hypothetical protein D6713_01670 [Deltaproteobacteria bacterium]|nr:MAG: hypothetical protein D6713_01670 [Deltaproteobacteria bacterium]